MWAVLCNGSFRNAYVPCLALANTKFQFHKHLVRRKLTVILSPDAALAYLNHKEIAELGSFVAELKTGIAVDELQTNPTP